MDSKDKIPDFTSASGKNESSRQRKGWHPFGTAIVLISIIVALLIAFWFAL